MLVGEDEFQAKRGRRACPATRNPSLGEEFIFAGRVASPRFPLPGPLGRGLRRALFHPILKATAKWAVLGRCG